jgi:hypothetical protein
MSARFLSILTIVSAAGMTSQEAPAFTKYASSSARLCTVLLGAAVASVASLLQVRIRLFRFCRVFLPKRGYTFKISNSPDYKGMTKEEAMEDLKKRVEKYEEAYETITDDSLSYIKIFNLSSKLLVNHIYGRMCQRLLSPLMAWNIGTRPVFLCRPGQTLSDIILDSNEYVSEVSQRDPQFLEMFRSPGSRLGPAGKKFSDALYDFVFEEGMDFLLKRSSMMDMAQTGTSVSGLARIMQSNSGLEGREAPFPLKIFTSTMPRAAETVRWEEYDLRVEELSNLNPLEKGDFAGKELEEVRKSNPSWYGRLEKDPFSTR